MYKIYISQYREEKPKEAAEIKFLTWLLQEILGYTNDEINEMKKNHFDCDIAKNLTIQEAFAVAQPFEDYDLWTYLHADDGTTIYWNQVGGLQPPDPKDHYCDEPMVSREHLIDPLEYYAERAAQRAKINPYIQQSDRQSGANTPKCPTCGSTSIQRIGAGEKVVSGALWGLFSNKVHKTYKCNNCKYMW